MIDILKDIVKHTHGLGFLDLVKITGDSKETGIDSMAEDRSVILQGSFHKPQAEMSGTFGMPQLGKLDIHLKCPEYKEKAKITVLKGTRSGAEVPTGIHFENAKGDPEPLKLATLGLKSIVSEARNPFFKCGTSFPNLSSAYDATV